MPLALGVFCVSAFQGIKPLRLCYRSSISWYNMCMKNAEIPQFVKPFLWSYEIEKLDLHTNKKLIIHNVLNFGSKKATDWLMGVYSKGEIQEVLRTTPASEWSKKSIALWELLFNVSPTDESRFV